jgi:hypothetical protein
VDHLPAVEALLVLSCCCRCTTPIVPFGNHRHNLISDPYSRIHFILTILTTNTCISFKYFFLHILCSLISSIYIIIFCSTMVIILFFIFKLLLFKSRTVIVWPLLIFLTISRVIELRFKWDWSRWKAKTRGYKFSEWRRT